MISCTKGKLLAKTTREALDNGLPTERDILFQQTGKGKCISGQPVPFDRSLPVSGSHRQQTDCIVCWLNYLLVGTLLSKSSNHGTQPQCPAHKGKASELERTVQG